MSSRFILLLLSVSPLPLHLQVNAQVNGYARLSAVESGSLTVSAADESAATFDAGKQVVVIQMQDDVIGSNTGNDVSFGDLDDIRSAGRYEVRRIASVLRSGPDLTEIILDEPLLNTYNFGPNTSVQAVTFELLGGGGDHTTTGPITALPWNGALGGVVAIEVDGVFTLAHPITADEAGFRGGARTTTTAGSCDVTTFRTAPNARHADKGEGIYRLDGTAYAAARGKLINGGGGGNEHNGGGGGGGNYAAGGMAGPGWNCGGGHAGGLGGIGLGAHMAADRVFMGGGGGGADGNNNVSTNGANGGGIIFIKAQQIRTTGSCGGRVISANGGSVPASGNDGGGGAGAGGAIIVHAFDFDVASGCPLTIAANGGTGGTVNSGNVHGAGGGGGQGAVIFPAAVPTSGTTLSTTSGVGGCNDNSSPCAFAADPGAGLPGDGIFHGGGSPLPIELLSFQAVPINTSVDISWSTASEQNNALFVVERSADLERWEEVDRIAGAGNSHVALFYHTRDPRPIPGRSYYRLRQVDLDGGGSLSGTVSVWMSNTDAGLHAFPNPVRDRLSINTPEVGSGDELFLIDDMGREVARVPHNAGRRVELQIGGLASGNYTLVFRSGSMVLHQRVVVTR